MKTALQELIENLQQKRDCFKADGNRLDRDVRSIYTNAIILAKALLVKEHDQLDDKYQEGYRDALQYGEDEAKYFGH